MSETEKMSLEDLGDLKPDMEALEAALLKNHRIDPNMM